MMRFPLLILATALAHAAIEPISDENLRTQALAAIFPHAAIAVVPGKAIDSSFRAQSA